MANCTVEKSVIVVHQGNRSTGIGCDPGETILEAPRRAEIAIPSQCEKAYCGSCMFQLAKGEVELAESYRLACQGFPVGAAIEIALF